MFLPLAEVRWFWLFRLYTYRYQMCFLRDCICMRSVLVHPSALCTEIRYLRSCLLDLLSFWKIINNNSQSIFSRSCLPWTGIGEQYFCARSLECIEQYGMVWECGTKQFGGKIGQLYYETCGSIKQKYREIIITVEIFHNIDHFYSLRMLNYQ